jgi:hypothetical protein
VKKIIFYVPRLTVPLRKIDDNDAQTLFDPKTTTTNSDNIIFLNLLFILTTISLCIGKKLPLSSVAMQTHSMYHIDKQRSIDHSVDPLQL